MGVHGLQYAVVRNIHGRSLARTLLERGKICSLRQSFVGGGIFAGGTVSMAKEVAYLALTPTAGRSMDRLAALQRVAPGKRTRKPVVVHPNEQYVGTMSRRTAIDYAQVRDSQRQGPLLHQPTIEVLQRWGVYGASNPERTADDMLGEQVERGFAPFVALDIHRLLSKHGQEGALSLDWCVKFAGALATRKALDGHGELGLSFRPDYGGDPMHLAQAIDGRLSETPHGEIIQAIADSLPAKQPHLRVTLGVPPAAFNNELIAMGWQAGSRSLVDAVHASALASGA